MVKQIIIVMYNYMYVTNSHLKIKGTLGWLVSLDVNYNLEWNTDLGRNIINHRAGHNSEHTCMGYRTREYLINI